jgi:hypothetical protein
VTTYSQTVAVYKNSVKPPVNGDEWNGVYQVLIAVAVAIATVVCVGYLILFRKP